MVNACEANYKGGNCSEQYEFVKNENYKECVLNITEQKSLTTHKIQNVF
jgi:hypothetical protein